MSQKEEQTEHAELTPEELEEQQGEELPRREVMSTIDPAPGVAKIPPGPWPVVE